MIVEIAPELTPIPPTPTVADGPRPLTWKDLPEIALTRADVPPGAEILSGTLWHGICAWSGKPYVFLKVDRGGVLLRFGWRLDWGLDPESVSYQWPQGKEGQQPAWVALDLATEEKRRANRQRLALAHHLRAAFRSYQSPEQDPTER